MRDKWLHVAVSLGLYLGLRVADAPKWRAAGLALSVGITREVIQRQGREGWRDMAANVVGVGVGLTLPLPR